MTMSYVNDKPRLSAKILVWFLCYLTASLPVYANQQNTADFGTIGRDAASFGQELAGKLSNDGTSIDGDTVTSEGLGDLDIGDLFPSTSSQNTKDSDYYFPGGNTPNTSDMGSIYDSGSEMDNQGATSKENLWSDAQSDNPSIQGSAYKVLLDTRDTSRPDMRNDPILNKAGDTYDNMDAFSDNFADCSSNTVFEDISKSAHIPKYRQCERVVDKSANCAVQHDYDPSVLVHHSGYTNLRACEGGGDCLELWIGRLGDNYWGGNCKIYEESMSVRVLNPEAVTRAVLDRAQWDDYMQVWVGQPGSQTKVWAGPNNNFPPETGGACELSTSWDKNPNTDVTHLFRDAKKGDVVNFKIRVSVTGNGEGFARIRVYYDRSKLTIDDTWTPKECVDAAQGVADGFADGSYSCSKMPQVANGCAIFNGVRICESELNDSPLPNINNLCQEVKVDAKFDFYKGQMDCWEDTGGNIQCPDNDGGNLNSCTGYEEDSSCGFIKSKCVGNASGPSGECYVFEDTYDCGEDVDLTTTESNTTYECAGEVRCMGSECIDPNKTQSSDFGKAAAMLHTAEFMAGDMECTEMDGTQNVSCNVFTGTAGECKKAVGGAQDCCESPSTPSLGQYLTFVMAVPKLDAAIITTKNVAARGAFESSYRTLRDPAVKGVTDMVKPVTNFVDTLGGNVDSISSTVTNLTNKVTDEVAKQLQSLSADLFGGGVGGAGTGGAVGGGAGSAGGELAKQEGQESATQALMNSPAGAILSNVMLAYTIYQVTMLAIQMIWACEEEELEMLVKRELNSCHHVGSYCKTKVLGVCIEKREAYCCFNSPLSRIIQEQVRPQLGLDWGGAQNPQCEGIPVERFPEINWDLLDLDEWLGMLKVTDNFPNEATIDLDKLTGAGSAFDFDDGEERKNTTERALDRLEGIDVDGRRYEATATMSPDVGSRKSQ